MLALLANSSDRSIERLYTIKWVQIVEMMFGILPLLHM